MAASTIHVDIVSAEGQIYAGEAEMVFVPAKEGELGITPRHAPLLSLIKAGEVRIKTAEGEQSIFVGGGALEIQPNKITILADTAVRAHDIDEAAALAAKQRAEEALAGKIDKIDQARALAELAQAAAQLKLLEKLRKTRG
jgi:F-type H+-transporting ATPase subunit epsilon